jgi:hypothetical protein
VKFRFIEEQLAESYPLEVACEVLEVSRSGYYAWRCRPASTRAKRRAELAEKVKAVHQAGQPRGVRQPASPPRAGRVGGTSL